MTPEHGQQPSNPVELGGLEGSAQDVSRVIADVESQLLRLKEADAQRRAFLVEIEKREQLLEAREQALAEQASQAQGRDQEVRELQQRLEAQRKDLGDQQSRVEARAGEVRELQKQLDLQLQEQNAASEKIRKERDQAIVQLAEFRGQADRLRQELESQQGSASAGHQELLDKIESLSVERDRLAAQVQQQGTATQKEVEDLREKVEGLIHERDLLSAELASARSRQPPVTGQSRAMPPARVASRMRRLRACRNVVSARARKLRRAGEVLQQRVEQCDTLLQQRRELAASKRALDELHKRVETARAKQSTALQLCVWLVTLSTLAGLSWVIAGRYSPPSFASKTVIAAETDGANAGDVVAWDEFHIELLTHPRLIERVAARLQRRGMTDVGTVDAVRTMIETSLTHRELSPGRLEVEVVAQGRERSTRLLETYVTALVAEANEARPRRRDGMATGIELEPVAGQEPVADLRPKYAGIGLAISAGTAALLWFGLWSAMAKVRARYEASSRLDEILNEARWVDPVPDVSRRAAAR